MEGDGKPPAKFKCVTCKAQHQELRRLNEHLKRCHKQLPVNTLTAKKFTVKKCDECDATFGDKSRLTQHQKLAHGPKKRCPNYAKCERASGDTSNLNKHIKRCKAKFPDEEVWGTGDEDGTLSKKGSITLTSVEAVMLTNGSGNGRSGFAEATVDEKSSIHESPANTTVFSTGEFSTSDVLRREAEMSDLVDSMIQSTENSIGIFAATPAAKKIREMITCEADSNKNILVPPTQPVDEDSFKKCSESGLVVVLDNDEDDASPQPSANHTSAEADDSQDIPVPATQACPISSQNLNGPWVMEDSAVESSFNGAGNLTFTVSPSPMKISTNAVTEENCMPFNRTYVMASTSDNICTNDLRNCTFSRQASSIHDQSKPSDPSSTLNSIVGEEYISSQKVPALFTTLEENSLNFTPLLRDDEILEKQKPVNQESLVVSHDDTKCEAGLESGPLSTMLSRISINTVCSSSPRRGKKSYVEPFFPVKADVDPVPKPAHDTSDSEDEEIVKKKNPARKLPIHNNGKRGKEAKADREALFEVENPRPSTSAALVRHNAREQKLKAKKKKTASEGGLAEVVSKRSKSNNHHKKVKTTIAKKHPGKKKKNAEKKSDSEQNENPVNADHGEIIPVPVPSAAVTQFSNTVPAEFRNEAPASPHASETANIVSDNLPQDQPMGLKMPDLAPAVSAEEDLVIPAYACNLPELPPPVLKSEVQVSQPRKRGGTVNRRIIEKVKNEEVEAEKLPSLKESPEQEVNHPSATVPQSTGRPRRKRASEVVAIDLSDDENENKIRAKKVKDGPHKLVGTDVLELSIMMTGRELVENCMKTVSDPNSIGNTCITGDDLGPPRPPSPPRTRLTKEQLVPTIPTFYVEKEEDAFSLQLQEFCMGNPITVVRGMSKAVRLDLGLFSTKTVAEVDPKQNVEIRTQFMQPREGNYDENGEYCWTCISQTSEMKMAKYAKYQERSFQESVEEEKAKCRNTRNTASVSDSRDSSNKQRSRCKKSKHGPKQIHFATNIDLLDEKKWRLQLQELNKLPAWARVISAGNMLTHVGHVIHGMNTVQLYMKVPGSRTPGHQENNNFCSININIGPGDCEWFAVPDAYWGCVQALCEKHNIKYLHGSWWPNLQDLYDAGCPAYRFVQRPGDLVWVNSGCVHWVQAVGWCNNIAWNVGPLTARQYHLAIDRYEWNKLEMFKSIVPMVRLTWNLARNVLVSDPKLFELIKSVLMRTLVQSIRMLEFVKMKNVEIRFLRRKTNDRPAYCEQCEVELFNILFIREEEKRQKVRCVECANQENSNLQGFICLEEFTLKELLEVYDNFRLCCSSSKILPLPPFISKHSEDSTFCLPQNIWRTGDTHTPALSKSEAGKRVRETVVPKNPPCWKFKKIRRSIYYGDKLPYDRKREKMCSCPNVEMKCSEDHCLNRLVFQECTAACGELCRNRRIQKHEGARDSVKRFMTDNKGWGLKAVEPIKKGDFILEYVGEVVPDAVFKERMHTIYAADPHHYCLQLGTGLVIDGQRVGGECRFVNHSCEPNCEMQKWCVNGLPRMGLFALRNIAVGEELSYDYNFSLYNPSEGQPCYCNSETCRLTIGTKPKALSKAKKRASFGRNDPESLANAIKEAIKEHAKTAKLAWFPLDSVEPSPRLWEGLIMEPHDSE